MTVRKALSLLRDLASTGDAGRRARYAILDRLSKSSGFRMYGFNTNWFENGEFVEAWRTFPEPINAIHDRRFNLYNLAKAFSHIPGDLAECGVYAGRGSHLMLVATAEIGKHLHGFDSFEGLSEPLAVDVSGACEWRKHDFSSPELRANRNLAAHAGRFSLYRGWIPERFSDVAERQFSFVHVDVDLYQPTLDACEFFWPRLSPGGALLCDDYGSINCPGARQAIDEFARALDQRAAELATGQGLLVKR